MWLASPSVRTGVAAAEPQQPQALQRARLNFVGGSWACAQCPLRGRQVLFRPPGRIGPSQVLQLMPCSCATSDRRPHRQGSLHRVLAPALVESCPPGRLAGRPPLAAAARGGRPKAPAHTEINCSLPHPWHLQEPWQRKTARGLQMTLHAHSAACLRTMSMVTGRNCSCLGAAS